MSRNGVRLEEETEEVKLARKRVVTAITRAAKWPFTLTLKGATWWAGLAVLVLLLLRLLPGNAFTWPLWLSLPAAAGFVLTIAVVIVASIKDTKEAKALKEASTSKMLQEGRNPSTPDPDAED